MTETLTGLDKTKLHERKWLPVEQIIKNADNPNKMNNREFDLLVDNIQSKGATEDIEVRQIADDMYRIIGGHHRFEACKYLGWAEVPCLINRDPEMDDEKEKFQMVRMNMIHGKLDPDKFLKMYEEMSGKYSDDLLKDMFGFADDKEFQKLIKETGDALPKELQAAFKEASKEIKTIEDLAKVLNELLDSYGDTLEYGYMIFDFNGKQNVWLRMKQNDFKNFQAWADLCKAENRAMDDVVMHMMKMMQEDKELFVKLIAQTPVVDKTAVNHMVVGGVSPQIDSEL
jgi:hypothetical protein